MAKVTREEILKIAEMTRVSIEEHEMDSIIAQFNSVLNYAECVVEIAQQVDMATQKNINCMRNDQVIPTDSKEILAQAPQSEDNYFVVPKFIDNK
ncbi:Asp-tRNA(Asn)/Glu-tRNA(Gln) amidotransferase subunit GatC [Candidatus Dependentiae bacterium]|nr:Asp-tRNA(Asn)/Glu-tRNA(Gln) amidotransferase subunit GatC [Candidatus Dependentiae bacterium]